MLLQAQCKHCRARLDTTGKGPGDSLLCGCGALVFVTESNTAPSALRAAAVPAVAPRSDLTCPRCRARLASRRSQSMSPHDCPACGGVWLSGAAFESICKKKEAEAEASGVKPTANAAVHATLSAMGDVTYIPCPVCGDTMNRQNFAKVSGVIIDICTQHGVWLDKQELSLIVHFIESGGMKKALAPSAPHPALAPAAHRLVNLHAAVPPAGGAGNASSVDGWAVASVLGDVAVFVLEIIADTI